MVFADLEVASLDRVVGVECQASVGSQTEVAAAVRALEGFAERGEPQPNSSSTGGVLGPLVIGRSFIVCTPVPGLTANVRSGAAVVPAGWWQSAARPRQQGLAQFRRWRRSAAGLCHPVRPSRRRSADRRKRPLPLRSTVSGNSGSQRNSYSACSGSFTHASSCEELLPAASCTWSRARLSPVLVRFARRLGKFASVTVRPRLWPSGRSVSSNLAGGGLPAASFDLRRVVEDGRELAHRVGIAGKAPPADAGIM